MRTVKSTISIIALLALAMAVPMLVTTNAGASPQPVGKGSPDGPTIGQYSKGLARPLSGAEKARSDAKRRSADAFYANALAAWRNSSGATAMVATSKTLAVPYYQQQTENWCGPTTLAMLAGYKGKGWSGSEYQKELSAAKLVTDPGTGSTWEARSTDWYGADSVPSGPWSSWYPMEDALNYRTYNLSHDYYVATALPGNPTSAEQNAFRSSLISDVNAGWPFAANQDSIPGYQIGWQPNGTWLHWWAARGYASSGNTTYFNDPASWSQRRMSSAPTTGGQHTVVVALGGRGYVW